MNTLCAFVHVTYKNFQKKGNELGTNKLVFFYFSSLLQVNHDITEKEIEEAFGSNLCRCTGYRPILDAFKSLAIDVNTDVLKKIKDIEDIDKHVCPKSGKDCNSSCKKEVQEWCMINFKRPVSPLLPKKVKLSDGKLWYTANHIDMIFETLDEVGYESYMLVAGNTAKGKINSIPYHIARI